MRRTWKPLVKDFENIATTIPLDLDNRGVTWFVETQEEIIMYHRNPNTGLSGKCNAKIPTNCPFYSLGEHFAKQEYADSYTDMANNIEQEYPNLKDVRCVQGIKDNSDGSIRLQKGWIELDENTIVTDIRYSGDIMWANGFVREDIYFDWRKDYDMDLSDETIRGLNDLKGLYNYSEALKNTPKLRGDESFFHQDQSFMSEDDGKHIKFIPTDIKGLYQRDDSGKGCLEIYDNMFEKEYVWISQDSDGNITEHTPNLTREKPPQYDFPYTYKFDKEKNCLKKVYKNPQDRKVLEESFINTYQNVDKKYQSLYEKYGLIESHHEEYRKIQDEIDFKIRKECEEVSKALPLHKRGRYYWNYEDTHRFERIKDISDTALKSLIDSFPDEYK